ncbi:hypothetical protein CBF34_08455 [Vagococcus penaei]|uniref:Uncharacterized protein n=2 Tax=Vagococcus penaei TaxID=633807 RepID=A0A1Q2D5U8_9ENTE|nr:hypothetical protein [Vagococcus penaei]AQP53758.1 hypothetical protein BW732_05575 [Vagococcus penaei]RSU00411.1 hypothetical protein CBF34_08455 [Vagococcus penaei]
MKKLICAKDIEQCHEQGLHTLVVDSKSIVTSLAKDLAEEYGISIQQQETACVEPMLDLNQINQDQLVALLKVLLQTPGILTEQIPFQSLTHESGLTQIKGKTIQLLHEKIDCYGQKLCYQELSKRQSVVTGRMQLVQTNYSWKEVTDYQIDVLDGELTVTTDNQNVFHLISGDTIFLPKEKGFLLTALDDTKLTYLEYKD